MNFKEGSFYKHRRMVDVYFKVLHKDGDSMNIAWYLVKSEIPMGLVEDVEISPEESQYYVEWPPVTEMT
jgi:hypothetical protein